MRSARDTSEKILCLTKSNVTINQGCMPYRNWWWICLGLFLHQHSPRSSLPFLHEHTPISPQTATPFWLGQLFGLGMHITYDYKDKDACCFRQIIGNCVLSTQNNRSHFLIPCSLSPNLAITEASHAVLASAIDKWSRTEPTPRGCGTCICPAS